MLQQESLGGLLVILSYPFRYPLPHTHNYIKSYIKSKKKKLPLSLIRLEIFFFQESLLVLSLPKVHSWLLFVFV